MTCARRRMGSSAAQPRVEHGMETPLMASRFSRGDSLEIFFLVSRRRSGVCCKPFVSASSCRIPMFRKAILIQLVIENLDDDLTRHVDLPLSIAAFARQPIGGRSVWRVSGAMV